MNDIIKEGLIIIFRGVPEEKLVRTIQAVYDGGGRIMEIAFDPSDKNTIEKTSRLIKIAVDAFGDKIMVGAGTVINTEFVVAAYNAGAKFIFSPTVNLDVIHLTKKLGMISIPGAFTPTECATAYDNGADIIKLFPVTKDDLGYIVNIARPLSHIPFICVGGTNVDTIKGFMESGAVGVGTGISILDKESIEKEDYDNITRLTKLHVEQVKKFK